jgi:subtilisin family serine protease
MHPANRLGPRRRTPRRLITATLLLAALAGTSLLLQGTASSAASSVRMLGHASGPLPARPAAGDRKLDSRLAALVDPKLERAYAASPGWRLSVPGTMGSTARVEIQASRPAAARAAVVRLGGTVTDSYRDLVEARVPKTALRALSQTSAVRFVRPPVHGHGDAITGEEVQASLASALQANGITGKGTKVAIIDGSFAGLADRQASGDLPTNVVTRDVCGGGFSNGDGHGTAVAEIVHEMAPGARLYLICFDTLADLASAEAYAKSEGVQIVNFSVEYFNVGRGTNDASDPVDAIVADARANGILWVNSAGNDAQTHWSGTYADTNGDTFTEFAPGNEGNFFVAPAGGTFCGFLKWDEWPAATSDFDLGLVDSTGSIVAASANAQNGTQPPTEDLCFQNTSSANQTFAWVIHGANVVTSPRLDLYTIETSPLQYQTAAGSIGDPASSPSAFAVGAVCWQNSVLEGYSSQGPTVDGRLKPDVAGHDSVSGATFGPFDASCPSGFAGTSASAPEVAGAAALVKQANPGFTADAIEAYLVKNATDLGPVGPDDQTGAGALHLPTVVAPKDPTRPKARALASSGRRGHVVKLLSRVSDNAGQAKIREQVKQNGRVIKTLTTAGFVAASTPRVLSFDWKAPPRITGSIQHCVRAQDRAGNLSAVSCARVTLAG